MPALIACLLLPAAAGAVPVDYLYIESNEGGSSGGHVALRIGDRAYDYQHHAPGVLRLERRDAGDFLYTYAYLQNRPVHATRLDVSEDETARLRDHFNGLYLSEQARFAALAVLDEDRRLLAALSGDDTAGSPEIDVAGAGYFLTSTGADGAPADSSPALVRLREEVARRFGRGWIARRLGEERKALRDLPPTVVREEQLSVRPLDYPRLHDAFSERSRDRAAAITALQVLSSAPAVRAGTSRPLDIDDLAIAPAVFESLAGLRARLAGQLVDLLESSRRDWGSVLLVGMARLDLLDRSIRGGRIEVLDVFPEDAAVVDDSALEDREALAALIADSRQDLETALGRIDPANRQATEEAPPSPAISESEWNDVEVAINRYRELDEALATGTPLRVAPGRLVPGLAAARPLPARPRAQGAGLAAMAARAGRRRNLYAGQLRDAQAYRLVGRNCVSELLANMEEALDAPAQGGARPRPWIDSGNTAARTVPYLSSVALQRSGRAADVHRVPSWREQRLAAAGAGEKTGVALRESNTLTSTLHRRAPDDSWFVMFTDFTPFRPVCGAINLATAAGAAGAGIAALPLDGPGPLRSALRGMLFSLPELFFVGIRKGSYAYVGRDAARLPEWW